MRRPTFASNSDSKCFVWRSWGTFSDSHRQSQTSSSRRAQRPGPPRRSGSSLVTKKDAKGNVLHGNKGGDRSR